MINPFSFFKNPEQSWSSFLLELGILIAVVLFVRFYVFQFFQVSGPSMCRTLNTIDGVCQRAQCRTLWDKMTGKNLQGSDHCEFIFVNEFLYSFVRAPERGEIVVFRPPTGERNYIKRLIGIPGDTVEVYNGNVFLTNERFDSVKLPEPYLSQKNQNRTATTQQKFAVPEGHFLLFGDNRNESLDARMCFEPSGCNEFNTPFVPRENIRGRAEFVVWPLNQVRSLSHEIFPGEDTEIDDSGKSVDSAAGAN
ncbi:MAG: signal peptidase I [Candidatus Gracilibacteria bacterium]|nr:signal peptidase I [Candidatus Gracilibacteria bacterium]